MALGLITGQRFRTSHRPERLPVASWATPGLDWMTGCVLTIPGSRHGGHARRRYPEQDRHHLRAVALPEELGYRCCHEDTRENGAEQDRGQPNPNEIPLAEGLVMPPLVSPASMQPPQSWSRLGRRRHPALDLRPGVATTVANQYDLSGNRGCAASEVPEARRNVRCHTDIMPLRPDREVQNHPAEPPVWRRSSTAPT